MEWRRGLGRWELVDEDGTVLGGITDECLEGRPGIADEFPGLGWPPLPQPELDEPAAVWVPWTPAEVLQILDGGPAGPAEAAAARDARIAARRSSETH